METWRLAFSRKRRWICDGCFMFQRHIWRRSLERFFLVPDKGGALGCVLSGRIVLTLDIEKGVVIYDAGTLSPCAVGEARCGCSAGK